jgi:hypothetical protein
MSDERTAQEIYDTALAQFEQARHYADFVPMLDSADVRVHELARLVKQAGGHIAERDGLILLLIPGGAGNGQTWDGRDYKTRRLADYKAEIPEGLLAEALIELNEDPPRPAKWDALQAIREAIKARHPKPQEPEQEQETE